MPATGGHFMTGDAHQKVNAGHHKRNSWPYVRQSTLRQLFENTESTKRQYGLRQHAIALAVTYFYWTIFDTLVAAFGFFLPPTVLPVLAGLLSRRLWAEGSLADFGVGIATGLAFFVYK
jgi:hypothetical protein